MEQQNHPDVEIINARIASTHLGFDGGAMFGTLQLQGKGFGVAFSGHVIHVQAQTQDQEDWQTAFGMEYITRILNTVGVQTWEALQGQAIRLMREGNQVVAIGHLIEEVWFEPRLLGEQYQKKANFQQEALSFYRQKLADDLEMMSQPQVEAEQPEQPEHTHPESGDGEEPRKYAAYDEPKQAE